MLIRYFLKGEIHMAILSLNEILRQDIQQYLGGSEAVLIKTITDLTARVSVGMDRVTVPRISGLALSTVTSGTRDTAGGMTTSGDALILNQSKQVPEYISYADGHDSAVDLKAAFLEAAPRVFAQGVEVAIAAQLETAGANDFDAASATAGVFTVDDIAKAKRILDMAGVPKTDRWLVVNALAMEQLARFQEFEDGSKSLSVEALRDGVVSQIKGFKVIQSEDVGSSTAASNKITCYHRSTVAFAMHSEVEFIEQMDQSWAQEFVAVRGKYGCKLLDAGARKVTISLTTATA